MQPIFESFFGSTTRDIHNANLIALGIPWDLSSSYRKGSSKGPTKIREATSGALYNPFTETDANIKDKWRIFDIGNISITSKSAMKVQKSVLKSLKPYKNAKYRFLFLGGDHIISYFAIKSLSELGFFNDKAVGILYLDAHPDLYPEYNGDKYSHACVLRRIIDETTLKPQNIAQVGIRASTPQQREYSELNDILFITRKNFHKKGPFKIADIIINKFIDNVDILYLSVDLDILDPAFAPGLGNPEPSGLITSEIIDFINELGVLPIFGFDIVELCPDYDQSMITAFAAAKIIKEVLGIMNV
jgi:agmatinase